MSKHQITSSSLTLRFPRFCSTLHVTDNDIKNSMQRSDIWCVRLLEQIFDYAVIECSKYVVPDRRRKRCGLFLGAMDAFPLVAARFFANKFSVLEVRRKVTIELLVAIVRAVAVEQRVGDDNDSRFGATGCRALLFSKFLSEEWDVDYLAIFLHYRDSFQSYCKISMVDLVAPYTENGSVAGESSTLPGTHPTPDATEEFIFGTTTSSTKKSLKTQSQKLLGKKTKLVAVKLPELPCKRQGQGLFFLPDLAFPGVPLVAFHLDVLPTLSLLFLPKSSLALRTYFADKIIESSSGRVLEALSSALSELDQVKDLAEAIGFKVNGCVVVPLYLVLYILCSEYEIVKRREPVTSKVAKQATASLKQLNSIYDHDCEAIKSMKHTVKSCDIELSNCNNEIMKLEKLRRRLERKWEDDVASEEEREELVRLRVTLTDKKADKLEIEERKKYLLSQDKRLEKNITELWDAVLVSGEDVGPPPPGADGEKKLRNQWRDDVVAMIAGALAANDKARAIDAKAKVAFEVSIGIRPPTAAVEIADSSVEKEFAVVEPPEGPEFPALSVEERLAALERDALDLANIATPTTAAAAAAVMIPAPSSPPAEIASTVSNDELLAVVADQLLSEELDREVRDVVDVSMAEVLNGTEAAFKADQDRVLAALDRRANMVSSVAASEVGAMLEAVVTKEMDRISKMISHRIKAEVSNIAEKEVEEFMFLAVAAASDKMVTELVRVYNEERLKEEATAERRREEIATLALAREEELQALLTAELKRRRELIEQNERQLRLLQEENIRVELELRLAEESECVLMYKEETRLREILAIVAQRALEEQARLRIILEEEAEAQRQLQEQELALMYREEERQLSIIAADRKILEDIEKQRLAAEALEMLAEFIRLADPWSALDEDPKGFVPRKTLAIVEKRHRRAEDRWRRDWRRDGFRRLQNEAKIMRNRKKCRVKLVSKIFRIFKAVVETSRLNANREKAALVLQKNLRALKGVKYLARLLERNRASSLIADKHYSIIISNAMLVSFQFLRFLCNRRKEDARVTQHLHERRLLVSWYRWASIYNKLHAARIALELKQKLASISIQCLIRSRMAKKKYRLKAAQLCIVLACRVAIAKTKYRSRAVYMRRLMERAKCVTKAAHRYEQKQRMIFWQKWVNFSTSCQLIFSSIARKRMRKRFNKLAKITADYRKKSRKSIIKIQSLLRMGSVKRHCLHYYKWRRGLCKLQGLVRRRIAMGSFYWILRDFRAAQAIQKIVRGRQTRSQFFDSRIRAIHYASANNNYDKLLYFANKFPELLNELDRDGNTALHNAAKNASRRTLKLLLKMRVDPNVLNLAGYSSLHYIITSKAINRDDCCLYMLERGFDEEMRTPDGKTCLLLACENGRTIIARQLLANGIDPNIPDNNGATCLQAACSNGSLAVVRDLLEYGADTNAPGRNGTSPLHDAVTSANIDITNLLFSHGAYINTFEPYYFQTPLMWACQAGTLDLVKSYLLQGGDVRAKDVNGWTAVHYATFSNDSLIFDALREADANFDAVNNDGETPLHLAVKHNSIAFLRALLEGCAYPSVQNLEGDQPIHLAARNNNVEAMKLLCLYDQHVSRVNYSHQTPLGVAQFYGSLDAVAFMEKHYVYLESDVVRDASGDVWWDREIDEKTVGWSVVVDATGERMHMSQLSGELTTVPPVLSAKQVEKISQGISRPIRRKIEMVSEENTMTMHQYKLDYQETEEEIAVLSKLYRAATSINKYARRKCAYLALRREKQRKRLTACMRRFMKMYLPGFREKLLRRKERGIIKLQGVARAMQLRKRFFLPHGEQHQRWLQRTKRDLARAVWRSWRRYKRAKYGRMREVLAKMPRSIDDWEKVVKKARRPKRNIGLFEEYIFPGTTDIMFYRNKVTRFCTFEKPIELENRDKRNFDDIIQIQSVGYTSAQLSLTTHLQAMWRGFKTRNYHKVMTAALRVSMEAERNYFTEPDIDHHLWNYALHCQVIVQDTDRARRLYMEALRRMEFAGPDQAFILYAYAIFAFVNHDLDSVDIILLIDRARKAEEDRENKVRLKKGEVESQAIAKGTFRYGKIFDIADIGFFRFKATTSTSGLAWHSYAASRFLIFNDFPGSFDAFLEGFRWDAKDKVMKANFDYMMRHFHGTDKDRLGEIVRERMRIHALKDEEINYQRLVRRDLAAKRAKAATAIQVWFKNMNAMRASRKFFKAIMSYKTNAGIGRRAGIAIRR